MQRSVEGNEYRIEFKPRLKAGGPIAGWIGYWGTKAIFYGTGMALVGKIFRKNDRTSLQNATIEVMGSEMLSRGGGIVAAAVSNHEGLMNTEENVAPIASMIAANTNAVAFIEAAATAVSGFLASIPFLP